MNGRQSSEKEAATAAELQPMAPASDEEKDDESTIGDIITAFAEDTSLPGLPRVILAKSKLSKFFWLFICLACLISFIPGIYDLLVRYFSYQKKVTVEMVSDPVPFPHVTLCNMRSIDFDILNNINDLLLQDPSILSFVGKNTGNSFIDDYVKFIAKFSQIYREEAGREEVNEKLVAALNEAISKISLYDEIPDDVISNASVQLEQYVARCSMGGVQCNLARDFRKFFDFYYFNCYTYDPAAASKRSPNENGDEELPFLYPGLDNGLSIVVLTGSGMLKRNEKANLIPGLYDMGSAVAGADGVRVVIHAPDVVPYPLTEGFDVPPGFSVSFGVRPRRNARIGPPHGDCVSENPFDEQKKETRGSSSSAAKSTKSHPYRQMVCQKQCIQKFVKEKCQCYDETLLVKGADYDDADYDDGDKQDVDPTPRCHATDHIPAFCQDRVAPECIDALMLQYDRVNCSKRTRDMVRASPKLMTACGCRAACDELLYDVSYSISKWPASGYEGDAVYDELLQNPAGSEFLDRFNKTPSKRAILDKHFDQTKDRMIAMNDFARINVYVADPEVIVTTESEDYDIPQLVADIGGQLGVWIGLTVISAAELIELVFQLVERCNKRRRQARKRATGAC